MKNPAKAGFFFFSVAPSKHPATTGECGLHGRQGQHA
jgi:hypothetical protein